jgi:hypothetical protein
VRHLGGCNTDSIVREGLYGFVRHVGGFNADSSIDREGLIHNK